MLSNYRAMFQSYNLSQHIGFMMSNKFAIGLLLPLLFLLMPTPLPLTTYLFQIFVPAFAVQILPKINLSMVERALFNISGIYLLFWVLSPILLHSRNAYIFINFDYKYLPMFAWLPFLLPLREVCRGEKWVSSPSNFELKWFVWVVWIAIWTYRLIF